MNVKLRMLLLPLPGNAGMYRSASERAPQYSTIGRSTS